MRLRLQPLPVIAALKNLDNLQISISRAVYFALGQNGLTEQARAQLDELAGSLSGTKNEIIEVHSFTDRADSNGDSARSEKCAAAVVWYLNEHHKVPVYRVHRKGPGKDMPAGSGDGREAWELNRGVQVKVYTLGGRSHLAPQFAL